MKQRFDELLPFYVNGTLPETDRNWVEAYLREHPKSAAELKWYESLQSRLREDVPAVSSEVGMERAMKRIRGERVQKTAARPAPSASTWGERAREWLAALLPQPVLRPVLAGALVVVVAQAVVIANLATESDDSSEIRATTLPLTAREADIRFLLVEVNGSLAGGPGQLGDWYVRIPQAQLDAVTAKLKASGIVEAVAPVDALPIRQ
jgi:hypothetical protein